jgi:hypothetical protein
MQGRDVLPSCRPRGTIAEWRQRGTQLILETLFDMRIVIGEIHEAVVEPEDDDEETEEDT